MKAKLLVLVLILALGATPALAQDGGTHTATFDGFGISWDAALADGVTAIAYEGEPVDLEAPGSPQPPHVELALFEQIPWDQVPIDEMGYPGSDRIHRGAVTVYRLADVDAYEWSQQQVDALQALLAERPDLSTYLQVSDNLNDYALPFLPVYPAGQVIRARAQYVETGAVTGISYVTVYRQDVSPFLASDFIYTFQGFSADGAHYVSMVFPITIEGFPADYPTDFDYDAFIERLDEYLAGSIAQINTAPAESFNPRLDVFDTIIESFAVASAGAA